MDENEVIRAVCDHLEKTGHKIIQSLNTTQQGIDVIAESSSSRRRIFVEAKGSTSSRKSSPRFGKPYTSSQIFDRVAKGIFTVLQLREKYQDHETTDVFLAVPEEPRFIRHLLTVKETLHSRSVGVFLVDQNGDVRRFE